MFRMLHTYEPFQLPLVAINTNPPPGRAGHISTDGFILPAVAAAGVTPSYDDHSELWNSKKGHQHTKEQMWAYASAVHGFHTWFAKAMTQIEIDLFAGTEAARSIAAPKPSHATSPDCVGPTEKFCTVVPSW